MPRLRLFHIKQIAFEAGSFTHVTPPETGFTVTLDLDKAQLAATEDKQIRKELERTAEKVCNKYRKQTDMRLKKFDNLFTGMIAKKAPAAAVAKQAGALKKALEKEAPKWEKAATREVMAALKKLAAKKR